MAISDTYYSDLTSDGDSSWVKVGKEGLTVTVDCVDGSGDSASWGSVEATLLYSPDGKMRSVVKEDGTAVTGTDGFTKEMQVAGYVAVAGSNISGETLRIKVQHPRNAFYS
ncbi:MAG: hypothetical protein CMK32_08100 [Porticoccaceae bacterium]|nr:hypothetical protein [Porticoccaceae bacterium]